uniref:Uncharacterized protein n=1 Tax=Babesia bovis TaxID=5865 RepID=S6B1V7_BABBO|nr:hypothetical protein [Babesia bovis]
MRLSSRMGIAFFAAGAFGKLGTCFALGWIFCFALGLTLFLAIAVAFMPFFLCSNVLPLSIQFLKRPRILPTCGSTAGVPSGLTGDLPVTAVPLAFIAPFNVPCADFGVETLGKGGLDLALGGGASTGTFVLGSRSKDAIESSDPSGSFSILSKSDSLNRVALERSSDEDERLLPIPTELGIVDSLVSVSFKIMELLSVYPLRESTMSL